MPGTLQADEFGHVVEILAKNVFLAPGEHGNGTHAEPEQPRLPGRIVQDIDGAKLDAFLRKKLFRSQAAASAGLNKKDEWIGCAFHLEISTADLLTNTYQRPQAVASLLRQRDS